MKNHLFYCLAGLLLMSLTKPATAQLRPQLNAYLERAAAESDQIPETRKAELSLIATYIRGRHTQGLPIKLLFVCTHNSRRSQMSQAWAKAIAEYVGIPGVETQSAGLEATAFNPRAISALTRAGFEVQPHPSPLPGGNRYTLSYGLKDSDALVGMHSKTLAGLDANWNDFAALMTCSDADEKCPLVPGASARFKLAYEDPKASDGTTTETATYDATCRQIAVELLYAFSLAQGGYPK
jgi:arsenate reductase (thioredoxin)